MLFNTIQFAIFFIVTLSGYRILPASARNSWLLAASLLFYALWVPVYLLLLLVDIFVNFALMHAMVRSKRPRLYLTVSIVFSFGILAYYKYAAFLIESVAPIFAAWGSSPLPIPDLVLPIGISFYTFQIVGLTVDVYRKTVPPIASLSRYMLFVSFFPQLIAGPILRGYEFLPQLDDGGKTNAWRDRRGLWLIATGILKKVVLADFLLAPFVDPVFDGPQSVAASAHLIAAYGFAFQIYFDFSGYTDMARGMGCLLGFELPLNFREPYLSRDPVEFWRRWHMTLSRWLRDYLYIPLGGNRSGARRTQLNLFLTMLLGGLWHGAGWTFVVWGAFHGAYLIAHRAIGQRLDPERALRAMDIWKIVLMFHAAVLLWIFFRAQSIGQALEFLRKLIVGDWSAPMPILPTVCVAFCAVIHLLERGLRLKSSRIQDIAARTSWGPVLEGVAFGAVIGLALLVGGAGGQFIYFQF